MMMTARFRRGRPLRFGTRQQCSKHDTFHAQTESDGGGEARHCFEDNATPMAREFPTSPGKGAPSSMRGQQHPFCLRNRAERRKISVVFYLHMLPPNFHFCVHFFSRSISLFFSWARMIAECCQTRLQDG